LQFPVLKGRRPGGLFCLMEDGRPHVGGTPVLCTRRGVLILKATIKLSPYCSLQRAPYPLGYNFSVMKWLLLTLIVAVSLELGAQEVAPHAKPKGRSVAPELNSKQKTDRPEQSDAATPPISSSVQCANCPVEQSHTQREEEKTRAASLDRLYRRYMCATIIGVIGGLLGLGLIFWQTIIAGRSANAAFLNAKAVIDSERPWLCCLEE
jgi:hypothetical protein